MARAPGTRGDGRAHRRPHGGAALLSAISAAGSNPVLLLALPAGALGDILDRRRLILASQVLMLLAAAALAVMAAASALTRAVVAAIVGDEADMPHAQGSGNPV